MLSTNSLSAFSAATTTPAQRTAPGQRTSSVRLVREPVPSATGGVQKNAIPPKSPAIAPPRGSLVNLSV